MAQKDPLVEYTSEGERMFTDLGRAIRGEVVLHLFHAEIAPQDVQELVQPPQQNGGQQLQYEHEMSAGSQAIAQAGSPVAVAGAASAPTKLGRNDACWCGSGKKFKKCHGA
jgi:preprotein translocase subunit SecA